jgi:proteasome lid subunit RPN8/RPN11
MAERAVWSTPECPFVVEYDRQALDDIRRAVSEAYFSLPRGGAEIGGILLGKWTEGQLIISGYAPLDCEHASGPSFVLSQRDREKLAALIASQQSAGAQVAGWYHSHTRSGVFLSDADQEIHGAFFSEPWQIALVLRPDTTRPTRVGIFFRDAAGAMRCDAAYNEFAIDPIAAPPGIPGVSPASQVVVDADALRPLVTSTAPRVPPQAPAPYTHPTVSDGEPGPTRAPIPAMQSTGAETLPLFLPLQKTAPRRWIKIAIPIALAAGLIGLIVWKRDLWMPHAMAMPGAPATPAASAPAGVSSPAALGLNTLDADGQLQIRWNRNSPAILQASSGTLRITGGPPSLATTTLDYAHLLSGVMTISRQSERVDITLSVSQRDGQAITEATSFAGALPERKPAAESAQREKPADAAPEMAKMRAELDAEIQRNKKLQKDVDFLAKQMRTQQRTRLNNQAPDKK